MSEQKTIIVGEYTIAKLRSGEPVEFDNGIIILPASDLAKVDATLAENERLREALEDFVKWSGAYPTDIFLEPDYEKAHALLQSGGMTLDALSAATLRLATKEIGRRASAALTPPPPPSERSGDGTPDGTEEKS